MHRSGTSLLSRAVESMGFSLGVSKCQLTSDENKKGFFENNEIIAFNDFLLEQSGGRWDSCIFDSKMLEGILNDDSIIDAAISLLNKEFANEERILIKDPRCCLLIPFWSKVLSLWGGCESAISYIYIYRDALEVAQSQKIRKQRNSDFYSIGDNYEATIALWLTYTSVALESLCDKNVQILNFKDIINLPEIVYKEISNHVGINVTKQQVQEFSDNFMDKVLYRSKNVDQGFSNNYPTISKIIKELDEATGINNDSDVHSLLEIINSNDSRQEVRNCEANVITELLSKMVQIKVSFKEQLKNQDIIHSQDVAKTLRLEQELADINEKSLDLEVALERVNQELSDINEKKLVLEVELERVNQEWSLLNNNWVFLNDMVDKSHVIKVVIASKIKLSLVKSLMMSQLAKLYFYSIRFIREYYLKAVSKWPVLHKVLMPLLKGNRKIKHKLYSNISEFPQVACDRYTNVSSDSSYRPLVSIIVPNYNHADFLPERLDSIFNQNYDNYEVIFLDDCSSDNSYDVLAEYQKKYSDRTIFLPNEENSGGVFNQWEKGIKLAKGDLVWIAESDDYCSENFLSELVQEFKDESVRLAFSNTKFVKDRKITWRLEDYLAEFNNLDFTANFVKPAYYLMNNGFGVKNLVPNVSSALFRRAGLETIIDDPVWKSMRVCGDWVFYSKVAVGGCIAYVASATNFYRQHDSNTSVTSHKMQKFYEEHHTVATYNIQNYGLTEFIIDQQLKSLDDHRVASKAPFSIEVLKKLYKPEQLKSSITIPNSKRLNILFVGYAFVSGGGETFPIQLANIFKEQGHSVTYLDCCEAEPNPGVRGMLREDIPVVNDLFKLNQVVQDFGIDIIHSHHAWVDVNIMEILNHQLDVRHVVSMHGMYEMMDDDRQREVITDLHQKCSHLVYTAEKNLVPLQKIGLDNSEKISKVDNALEVYDFEPVSRKELGISDQAKVLCLVSRAIEDKGWKEAIEATQIAREKSTIDIQLILIGDGPEHERLFEEGVPDFVHLLGFRSNIREYFAMSDFALLPSRFKGESYPLVVIDAIHAGVPVIATDVGEVRNMLTTDHGVNGELLPLSNWTIDTYALGDLMLLAMSKAYESYLPALQAAKAKFSPERLYQDYLSIYNKG